MEDSRFLFCSPLSFRPFCSELFRPLLDGRPRSPQPRGPFFLFRLRSLCINVLFHGLRAVFFSSRVSLRGFPPSKGFLGALVVSPILWSLCLVNRVSALFLLIGQCGSLLLLIRAVDREFTPSSALQWHHSSRPSGHGIRTFHSPPFEWQYPERAFPFT